MKVTERDFMSANVAHNDLLHLVDVDDTAQDASGSSYKCEVQKLGAVLSTVKNTVFVSKSGNDSTGIVERSDLPFLTIAAARAALVAYYTGGTAPSSTNRIRVVVISGTYTEQLVLANYVDWDLTDAIIQSQSSSTEYTIDDNNVACNSIIYGAAIIKRSGGNGGCIRTQNSSTILSCTVNSVSSSTLSVTDYAIRCANGTQYIWVKAGISTVSTSVYCEAGTQDIHGNVASTTYTAVKASGGIQYIYGNVSCANLTGVDCSGGIQYIYGNSSGSNTGVVCSGGTQYIYGNCSATAGKGASCSSGTQIIKGRIVTTSTNTDAYIQTGGTAILDSCTLIATGTGKSISNSSTVKIYGGCQGNNALGSGVTQQVGTIIIDSSVV